MFLKYPKRQKLCPMKKTCYNYARNCDICTFGQTLEKYERRAQRDAAELKFLREHLFYKPQTLKQAPDRSGAGEVKDGI